MAMRRLWILTLPLMVGACDRRADDRADPAADTAAAAGTAEVTAELLAPVRAVSLVVVEQAQLGVRSAAQPDVQTYARTAATDHRALIAVLDSAAGADGAVLHETDSARQLAHTVRTAHAGLDDLPPTDFDLAFVRAQIETHRQLLDTIDRDLQPGATNAELRSLFGDIRGLVDAHLTRGRQLLGVLVAGPADARPASRAPLGEPAPSQPPPARDEPPEDLPPQATPDTARRNRT